MSSLALLLGLFRLGRHGGVVVVLVLRGFLGVGGFLWIQRGVRHATGRRPEEKKLQLRGAKLFTNVKLYFPSIEAWPSKGHLVYGTSICTVTKVTFFGEIQLINLILRIRPAQVMTGWRQGFQGRWSVNEIGLTSKYVPVIGRCRSLLLRLFLIVVNDVVFQPGVKTASIKLVELDQLKQVEETSFAVVQRVSDAFLRMRFLEKCRIWASVGWEHVSGIENEC